MTRDYPDLGSASDWMKQIFSFLILHAVVFSLLNSHEEALKLRETALAIYAEQLGEHPFLGTIYNYLGNDCMALGNADRAVEYFTEALRIRTTLLGHFHQETARTWHDLGVALKMKVKEIFNDLGKINFLRT